MKLEERLGFPIFDRSKKPIKITPPGYLFIKQARQVLHEYDVLMTVSQTAEPVQGMFRLGIMPTVSPYIVPLFLEKFFACESAGSFGGHRVQDRGYYCSDSGGSVGCRVTGDAVNHWWDS